MRAALFFVMAAAASGFAPPSFDPSFGAMVWVPVEELTDEFDGTSLNTTKWAGNSSSWQGRQPGLFEESNVVVADGAMKLFARHENVADAAQQKEGYENYTTALVEAKTPVLYGLFEIEWQSGSSTTSSSWWFSKGGQAYPSNSSWAGWRTEIDVFETNGNASNRMSGFLPSHTHVFDSPYGSNSSTLASKCNCTRSGPGWTPVCSRQSMVPNTPGRWSDGLHKAVLNWNETNLDFYIDGSLYWGIKDHCMQVPLIMDFDRETMPNWMGLAPLSALPDAPFVVNYVRTWQPKTLL